MCSAFSSRIYLRVLHTRVRRCRRKASIIQCKQREAETLENTTPRATLKSESIRASKLHKRRQLFSQTTQGAELRANRNKGCNSGNACYIRCILCLHIRENWRFLRLYLTMIYLGKLFLLLMIINTEAYNVGKLVSNITYFTCSKQFIQIFVFI